MRDEKQGTGRMRRGNPPVSCVCPKCGKEYQKVRGVPCRNQTCTDCGATLVGK
ncbi:MAG: hypothetical protein QFX32_03310 [Methanolinea sp.]|nr:hypothetical protein [Methanolinea sp.]